MSNRIVITIEVPDGVVPDVSYSATQTPAEPRREDYPPPIEEGPLAEAVRMFPPEQAAAGVPPMCPRHRTPMKFIPGGVSKASGKAYVAFWGCATDRSCPEKRNA